MSIFLGAIITVVINNKKTTKKDPSDKTEQSISYKITRKNNKYSISNTEGNLLNKNIENIFYDGKIAYICLSEEKNATILKYDVEKDKTSVIYENDETLVGGVRSFGKNYIINNYIYDKNFKKIEEYNYNETTEQLYPNLKSKLVKQDNKVLLKSLETDDSEKIIAVDDENKIYSLFLISDDSKSTILKEKKDDKTKLIYITDEAKKELKIGYNEEYNYRFLTSTYLLEEKVKDDLYSYKIYDIKENKVIFSENSKNKYLFYKTKVLYTDNESSLILKDYVTLEENSITYIDSEVTSFVVPGDNYTLLLHYKELENVFYIYYL